MKKRKPSASGRKVKKTGSKTGSAKSISYRGKIIPMTPSRFRKLRAEQKHNAYLKAQEKSARAASAAYKPRKRDRGKVILIGVKGQKDPQKKGRKGYPVYVTSTGKVQLLRPKVAEPFKARKLREVELPLRKNLHKKVAAFESAKLVQIGKGKVSESAKEKRRLSRIIKDVNKTGLTGDDNARLIDFKLARGKGGGKVETGKAGHDFSQRAVDEMADSFAKIIRNQKGQRIFNIHTMALVELPDGTREVIEFSVRIERNDQDAIRVAGVRNFINRKFYAHMAQNLAFCGVISSGSANHIRKFMNVPEVTPQVWNEYNARMGRATTWGGGGMAVARIISLEWRFEQSR